MEVELFEDVINHVRSFEAVLVYAVEGIARCLHRQRRNVESLVVGRDSGDAGGDTNAHVIESTQLPYNGVDFSGIRSSRIKDRFRVIEYYEHLLGR